MIYIYDPEEPFSLLSEEVQERAVLTMVEAVVGIIGRSRIVAWKQQQAASHLCLESRTAGYIGFFVKHSRYI